MLNQSQKDCQFCVSKLTCNQLIKQNLDKKYMTSKEYYNVKIVNDVIYNEPTHVVSVFKDYLIYDDVSEFLKRTYTQVEAMSRLPKIYDFYEKYSKVFPNFVILEENKYMFKNIERKQRLIDDKQKIQIDNEERAIKNKQSKKKGFSDSYLENRMFNTGFVDSVLENHNPSIFENSSVGNMDQSSSRIIQNYVENSKNAKKTKHEDKTAILQVSIE